MESCFYIDRYTVTRSLPGIAVGLMVVGSDFCVVVFGLSVDGLSVPRKLQIRLYCMLRYKINSIA